MLGASGSAVAVPANDVWSGFTNPKNEKLKDLNLREFATLMPLVVMGYSGSGIYPKPFFRIIEKPVNQIVAKVQPGSFPDRFKQQLCQASGDIGAAGRFRAATPRTLHLYGIQPGFANQA